MSRGRLTGIDTNVLLRYLLRDDPGQFDRAAQELEALTPENPGFVTHVTLAEVYWVLSRARHLERAAVLVVIRRLVHTAALEFEDGETVVRALQLAGEGDRKSTRLNSSHVAISYAVFCLRKKRRDD